MCSHLNFTGSYSCLVLITRVVSTLNEAYMVGSCCYCFFLQIVSLTVQSSEEQNLTLILRCLCSYVMNLVSWYSGVVSNVFLTYSFKSGFMVFECPCSCWITYEHIHRELH